LGGDEGSSVLGAGEVGSPELRCLEYWTGVLREYPDLPNAVAAILESRRARDVRAEPESSIRLVDANGQATVVRDRSVHVVIVDLDTPSLERLLATLGMVDKRGQEVASELAQLETKGKSAREIAAEYIAGVTPDEPGSLAQPLGIADAPFSSSSATARRLGGPPRFSHQPPTPRQPPTPPPTKVVILGSGALVEIGGVGGTDRQHVDIQVFDDGVRGTGRVEIYAFSTSGHRWGQKFQQYLTSSGKAARPPPTAEVLAIGSLYGLSVGDVRDSAHQEIKLNAWVRAQAKRSDDFVSEAVAAADHIQSRVTRAKGKIAAKEEVRDHELMRERIERIRETERVDPFRDRERFEVRPRAP
jgi:hypothetical protein